LHPAGWSPSRMSWACMGWGAMARIDRPGGGPGGLAARVVSIDQRDDLAVLAVPGEVARGNRSVGGDRSGPLVLALRGGRVRAVRARWRRSIIAHITTPDGHQVVDRPALELAATVRSGDSGAPVVGADGRVIGVVFARSDGAAGVAYAVDGRVLGRESGR
jgi:S1-C subfamily serine protease